MMAKGACVVVLLATVDLERYWRSCKLPTDCCTIAER
jgi:hypothetical protein